MNRTYIFKNYTYSLLFKNNHNPIKKINPKFISASKSWKLKTNQVMSLFGIAVAVVIEVEKNSFMKSVFSYGL